MLSVHYGPCPKKHRSNKTFDRSVRAAYGSESLYVRENAVTVLIVRLRDATALCAIRALPEAEKSSAELFSHVSAARTRTARSRYAGQADFDFGRAVVYAIGPKKLHSSFRIMRSIIQGTLPRRGLRPELVPPGRRPRRTGNEITKA